jgi:hypothetical protein
MYKQVLLISVVALVFTACGGKKDEKWTGFIYPTKENTKRNVKSPMTFETLEECQDSSLKQLKLLKLEETGAYKCGLNCEFHDGMKLEVCEKMVSPKEK